MVTLIPLPAKTGGHGAASIWFNPEHITTLTPIVERSADSDGDLVILSVDMKLQGLPISRHWLASSRTTAEADVAWQGFLAALHTQSDQPASSK
jgi:hypothetical protein